MSPHRDGKRRAKSGNRSSLPLERLQEVKERVAQGFYNSPAVTRQVVERLLADPQFLKTL